jgi:hypothetical protein
MLKDQFRKLHFVPVSAVKVGGDSIAQEPDEAEMVAIPRVKENYQEHGWPNLERFRKKSAWKLC